MHNASILFYISKWHNLISVVPHCGSERHREADRENFINDVIRVDTLKNEYILWAAQGKRQVLSKSKNKPGKPSKPSTVNSTPQYI